MKCFSLLIIPLLTTASPPTESNTKEIKSIQGKTTNQQEFAKLVKKHIECGDIYQINKLGKQAVNFNLLDETGQSPLHFAITKGLATAVELLLKNNANINFPDCNGLTPLHYACRNNNLEVVKLLRSLKVKINIQDNNGQYPLELTENKEIMRILILAGAKGVNTITKRIQQRQEQITNDYYTALRKLSEEYGKEKQEYDGVKSDLNNWVKQKNKTLQHAKQQLSFPNSRQQSIVKEG